MKDQPCLGGPHIFGRRTYISTVLRLLASYAWSCEHMFVCYMYSSYQGWKRYKHCRPLVAVHARSGLLVSSLGIVAQGGTRMWGRPYRPLQASLLVLPDIGRCRQHSCRVGTKNTLSLFWQHFLWKFLGSSQVAHWSSTYKGRNGDKEINV